MSVSQRSGKKGWATCTNKNSAVAEMGDRLATIVMGRKVRAVGPLSGGGSWVKSLKCNTVWPGPRPTPVPSGILFHAAVWSQYMG